MLSSASDNVNLFGKNLSNNLNLDYSGISLPVFSSRTNLKLHNISITSKMVKKVIRDLDSSKVSGPDCIPVALLENCEPELSYILAELFNTYLKESCFPDCWRIHQCSVYFRMLGKGLLLKTAAVLVFFLWLVKSLKKLVNNRIVDHLEKCGHFFRFSVWF